MDAKSLTADDVRAACELLGLRTSEWAVLDRVLWRESYWSQESLAQELGRSSPSVYKTLSRLEARGVLVYQRNRRRQRLAVAGDVLKAVVGVVRRRKRRPGRRQ